MHLPNVVSPRFPHVSKRHEESVFFDPTLQTRLEKQRHAWVPQTHAVKALHTSAQHEQDELLVQALMQRMRCSSSRWVSPPKPFTLVPGLISLSPKGFVSAKRFSRVSSKQVIKHRAQIRGAIRALVSITPEHLGRTIPGDYEEPADTRLPGWIFEPIDPQLVPAIPQGDPLQPYETVLVDAVIKQVEVLKRLQVEANAPIVNPRAAAALLKFVYTREPYVETLMEGLRARGKRSPRHAVSIPLPSSRPRALYVTPDGFSDGCVGDTHFAIQESFPLEDGETVEGFCRSVEAGLAKLAVDGLTVVPYNGRLVGAKERPKRQALPADLPTVKISGALETQLRNVLEAFNSAADEASEGPQPFVHFLQAVEKLPSVTFLRRHLRERRQLAGTQQALRMNVSDAAAPGFALVLSERGFAVRSPSGQLAKFSPNSYAPTFPGAYFGLMGCADRRSSESAIIERIDAIGDDMKPYLTACESLQPTAYRWKFWQ